MHERLTSTSLQNLLRLCTVYDVGKFYIIYPYHTIHN